MVGAKINICQTNKGRNEFGFLEIATMVACLPDDNNHVIPVEGHEGSAPFSIKAIIPCRRFIF